MTKYPTAVLISDVHFSLQNLELASKAMALAADKANELEVPLLVCGDLHDTKANMRGECVAAMLEAFKRPNYFSAVLVGNHDLINERSKEHSLEFLKLNHVTVYDTVDYWSAIDAYLIPYHSDVSELRKVLNTIPKDALLIMHQGLNGSDGGEYIQDKSALNLDDVAGRRIISGHYHNRQTIQLPDGGTWDYVGSPFTMTYGEANDPPKGFQVLYSDFSLEFVPTNLPKHIVLERNAIDPALKSYTRPTGIHATDKVWVKITAPSDYVVDKAHIGYMLGIIGDFRLTIIPTELKVIETVVKSTSAHDILDAIIDSSNVDAERINRLKNLWKALSD